MLPPDDDEYITLRAGVTPYAYLERIAICMLEGGLSERDAMQVAMEEHQQLDRYTPRTSHER